MDTESDWESHDSSGSEAAPGTLLTAMNAVVLPIRAGLQAASNTMNEVYNDTLVELDNARPTPLYAQRSGFAMPYNQFATKRRHVIHRGIQRIHDVFEEARSRLGPMIDRASQLYSGIYPSDALLFPLAQERDRLVGLLTNKLGKVDDTFPPSAGLSAGCYRRRGSK